ncbi:topoisomerase DNA-binding C4 zinc finger domain-containing protein [Acetobacterium wieringae]|uniref:Topoisomerase DNA-binding C4 zinc finger domain-containing protein n=1 Tax=Acetobacterium wieringae TaxID=52694 RepID=A0ABY6HE38_9FIRM|nr:topoisomerase DNA-binding C4 zinc finger domain-containing protein [Acetobacterium wieringae]UYO62781.1 topoisomerase DNA-binding C4 zinc finger domain-containing protein [Acetobacterium wieringae]
MNEFIREGWQDCDNCGKEYLVRKVKYPITDSAHTINCPYCYAIVGKVPKGTDDYDLLTKEEMLRRQEDYNSRPECPECGKKMVIREGYSKFWGCSNFPTCNGSRKIQE